MKTRGYASTHVGRRQNNEDAYLADFALRLFLVADGMGGYEGGEIASHLVVDTVRQFFHRGGSPSGRAFERPEPRRASTAESMMEMSLRMASREVERLRRGRLSNMGSTAASVLFGPQQVVVAHVGDSRVYRMRGGRLDCLTRDHSVVAEMQEAGVAAAQMPESRSMITRAVGVPGYSRPDVTTFEAERGDLYLLCTDGLTDVIEDDDLADIVRSLPPHQAVDALVADAYDAGSHDNITALLVECG